MPNILKVSNMSKRLRTLFFVYELMLNTNAVLTNTTQGEVAMLYTAGGTVVLYKSDNVTSSYG